MPDFDALWKAVAAHGDNATAAMADQGILWTALFSLDEWHILFAADPSTPRPQILRYDGQKWAMVFTDKDRLQAFAKEMNLTLETGHALFVSLDVPAARRALKSMGQHGIHGARFNQGENGWFSPMPNIEAIHQYLVNDGSLP